MPERKVTASQLPCVTRCVTRPWALAQGRLVQAEYHLSLSRTVAVRKHQIQPLLADLRRCLAGTPRRAAGSTLMPACISLCNHSSA